MDIRTFTGHTLVEALSQVKRELGEDAVILSSRRVEEAAGLPDGHSVEVVAAQPAPQPARRPNPRGETRAWTPPRISRTGSGQECAPLPAPLAAAPGPLPAAPPITASPVAAPAAEDWQGLRTELQELRRAMKDMDQSARFGSHRAWSVRHEQALRTLCGRGMSRPTACSLLDELEDAGDDTRWEKALTMALARRLPCVGTEVPDSSPGPRIEVLVGPTGVGKTTMLAKLLLHRDGLPHRRAGVLSLDTKRVAAVEQIRRLAGILRVPLEQLYRPGDLAAALDRLSGCDLILVDTPGTGPRERLGLERTRTFLRSLKTRHVHVVLAATMRLEDQLACLAPWRQAGADRLLLTKVDEATGLGALVDLAAQAALPVSYVGTGQRIPDDLARPEAALLARWILRGETFQLEETRSDSMKRIRALVSEARLEA